jgi:transposase
MELINSRCAGLDIHKKSVVACRKVNGDRETRTFRTFLQDLRELGKWLEAGGVTTVAMESTGVYWKPIWNLLEAEFSGIELVLANAEHVKQVPGRKTDVCDAAWLADLHSCGLIQGSRVMDRVSRELQELVRTRRRLIQERSRTLNRIVKVLEGANLKLASVVSTVTTKSGMAVIEALSEGEDNPRRLMERMEKRLKSPPEDILAALEGTMGYNQRLLLQVQLDIYHNLSKNIQQLDREVEQQMLPFTEQIQQLDEVPGLAKQTAQEVLAYIGLTIEGFPSAGHLASWVALCPGNSISAGKKTGRGARKGNGWLKSTMVEAAWSAVRTKGSYFRDLYQRKKASRGSQKAIVAVAHAMLVTIYTMLKKGTKYEDLGADFHKMQRRESLMRRRVRELHTLGYAVQVRDTFAEAA